MTCYHPLTGYRSRDLNANGKRSIVFSVSEGYSDLPVKLPCGQCIGCRLERSRQWAMRCVHEAKLHDRNSFITLTYSDENLPKDGSLQVKHFQDFMKRLRWHCGSVRYFHCGEYGEKFGRPHYHACLFGFDFPDKTHYKTVRGNRLYTSELLNSLWENKGFCIIGDVTFESAAYVARYITKKITGPKAEDHYSRVNSKGEIFSLAPEYTTMSRRPGIARDWFKQFSSDVYPKDFVTLRGKKLKPPKYYDSLYEIMSPKEMETLKRERRRNAAKQAENNTYERLRVREKIQLYIAKLLKRSYENGN